MIIYASGPSFFGVRAGTTSQPSSPRACLSRLLFCSSTTRHWRRCNHGSAQPPRFVPFKVPSRGRATWSRRLQAAGPLHRALIEGCPLARAPVPRGAGHVHGLRAAL